MSLPTSHDQEHLWPPLTNLELSEELRLLRARIALLERQQMMNSTTSSCVSFDAQNANGKKDAADTLCGQNDAIVPSNGKEGRADQQQQEGQTKADQLEVNFVSDQKKLTETHKKLEEEKQLNVELLAKIDELERKQKADQQKKHRAKIDERQQEGGRGGGRGGGGFGRPNRDNEGSGLPRNNFSDGGGFGSSGNDGFSNSGWGGGEGRGARWNWWNDGRERGRGGGRGGGGGGFGRPNRDNEGGGLPSNNFSGGGRFGSDASGTRPNSILRIIIDTMPYPALDVLYRIFSCYGKVLRIITFNKNNSFQALIQLSEADFAQNAKNSLDGCNIYNGFCKLHIEYSKWSTLRVGRNNDKSRDYSNPIKFCGGGGFGRHNEGGGLPSNDFSGGGGSGSSGNDGFSNSGWGGGEGRGARWNRWNDGRERGRGGGGFGRPNRDNERGGLSNNDFSGGGGFGSSGQHNQQQQHNHHAHRQLHNSESAHSCTSSLVVQDDLAAPDQHYHQHQQHTSSSQTRLCHRLGPSSSLFASCSITGQNNRSDSVGPAHSATAAFSLPGSSLMSQKLTSHRVQQQSAADDGPHNSPEIIFVDDVIRNKWVPPIGQNGVKNELGGAELIGIEEDVPSGEPVLNSPRAKKVKKEEPKET